MIPTRRQKRTWRRRVSRAMRTDNWTRIVALGSGGVPQIEVWRDLDNPRAIVAPWLRDET